MANVKKFIGYTTTAKTVYGIIERQADSYLLNDADGAFAAAPADPYVSFSEHATIKGEYTLSESRTAWNDGLYKSTVYEQAGGSPAPVSDLVVAFQYMYIRSDLEIVNDADLAAILLDTTEIGTAGAGLTALGDTRIANLDAAISTRLAPAGTLATVTNLTNAPSAGDFTATMKTSLNASTPASVQNIAAQTGDSYARLGAPAGASVSADILAIDNFVDELESHLIIRKATINDVAPTTTVFDTTLTEATNNYWNNGAILFTVGANSGVIRAIKDYDGTAKEITLNTALPVAPSNGDAFSIIMVRAFKLAGLEAQEIRDAMKLAPTAGAPAAGSVDLHLDDIEADTDDIGAAGAGLTALGDARLANLDAAISTRATPAQVNTEVDTALSDVNLDHLVGTAAAIPAIPAGTYIDQMIDDGVAVYDRTTDSLQAIRDRGDAVWITATGFATAAVCTEARLAELDAANLPTDVANVKTDTAAIKVKTDALPSGIEKNIALSNFQFYMVLSSDHVTAATGKTVAGTISKDGGVFAALTNAISEIGNGMYKVNLTQTEMNADVITLKFTEASCDQRIITVYTA